MLKETKTFKIKRHYHVCESHRCVLNCLYALFFHWNFSPSLEFGLQTISLVLAPQMISHLSVSSNDLPRTSQTKQRLSISRSKVDHGWEWSTPVDHLWSTPICPIISNHPSVWLIWSFILTNIQSLGALNYNSTTARGQSELLISCQCQWIG